jgi:hypothetical protein
MVIGPAQLEAVIVTLASVAACVLTVPRPTPLRKALKQAARPNG